MRKENKNQRPQLEDFYDSSDPRGCSSSSSSSSSREYDDFLNAVQKYEPCVVYKVYPDSARLDIGENKLSAIFKHKSQAEAFAGSMWGRYYIIEEVCVGEGGVVIWK